MKKFVSLFLCIGIVFTLLTACTGENHRGEDMLKDKENPNAEVTIEKGIQGLELLEKPLLSYFGGSLYEGSITLDISDIMDKYYEEQGIETISVQKLVHVKLTEESQVIDLEGQNISVNEISPGDIVYLDFDINNRIDELSGEPTIETDLLVIGQIIR